jgi:uncharacterized protein YbjT (DUF2867 family)
MTTNDELILVTGGTGKTGRRVAQRLRAAGRTIRVASRNTEPPLDWDNRATWAPVLDGVHTAYLAYAPDAGFPGADTTLGAFAQHAVTAGVRRLVLLTGRGEAGAVRSEQAVLAAADVAGGQLVVLGRRSSHRTSAKTSSRRLCVKAWLPFPPTRSPNRSWTSRTWPRWRPPC